MYSIKALSRITGIPPNTLRSWERRYGIPGPSRDDMGFRLYTAEDASYLSLIGRLIAGGHSIGKLAGLPRDELEKLESQFSSSGPDDGRDVIRRRLLEAIDDVDLERFRQTLVQALVNCSPVNVAAHVLSPALQHIGRLWEQGRLSVAAEHALSAVARQLIFASVNMYQWVPSKARMAFATLPNEQHELGCLLAYYIAAARGHHCTYFGPNMPATSLAEAVSLSNARILVLSIIAPADKNLAAADLEKVAQSMPQDAKLWIGTHVNVPHPAGAIRFEGFEPYDKHLLALS